MQASCLGIYYQFRFLDATRHALGLTGILKGTAPVGNTAALAGEEGLTGAFDLVLERRLSPWSVVRAPVRRPGHSSHRALPSYCTSRSLTSQLHVLV